jgi:hypothetical protein
MLRVDPTSKTLIPVAPTTLTQASILERTDLQAAAQNSWDAFCSELGFAELFFVGSEIIPHESCRDRIDMLALSRDGTTFGYGRGWASRHGAASLRLV